MYTKNCKYSKHMMKIAHKEDCNALLKSIEGANSSVTGASIRIMTSHFVALLVLSLLFTESIANS